MVHSEEEALGTRLTIDSLTCLLANETDPSKLLAISPGKLMRYLVPDEGYVQAEQPYAEIEVLIPSSPSKFGALVMSPADLHAQLRAASSSEPVHATDTEWRCQAAQRRS